MSTALAGTRPLLKTSLKHDLHHFGPWIAFATALSASSVLVYPWVFRTAEDREALASALSANPAVDIIFGPAFNLATTDGFNAWRALALGGFLTALGAIFAVVRSTRGQEDSGQAELLASGVLGPGSRLLAGVSVALIGSVVVGIVAATVTVLCGGGLQATLLIAATFTMTGWMFTGVAAVTSQLGTDARTASSLAVGLLGTLFILRGFAYALDAPAWTVWINPLGWMTQTRPASSNDWLPMLMALAFVIVVLIVAFWLQSVRDFGQGAIAPRPGPARGRLHSAPALVLALNRGRLITWVTAFVLLGIVFGYFARSLPDLLRDNLSLADLLAFGETSPAALASASLIMIFTLIGIIAAVPGIQAMLRVRSEELEDRVEPVLAGAITRQRYYSANVTLALIVPTVCVLLAGTIVAFFATGAGISLTFNDVLLQALATIPAVWTVTSISVFVVGARRKFILAAWVGVVASFALSILGPIFGIWDWILAISPFWHVPEVVIGGGSGLGLLAITVISGLFVTIGFLGFSQRDIATT